MIFQVKRVKEFSVSKLDITTFSEMHNIDPVGLIRIKKKNLFYSKP